MVEWLKYNTNYQVKEYDSLEIAGIKFLYSAIGYILGAFSGSIATLIYLWH